MDLKSILYKIAHWETWDWRLKYVPLIPSWLWYSSMSRSFWFFTPSNPSLVFGGFDGVSKKDMYAHLPPGLYPRSIYISVGTNVDEVERAITTCNLKYPLVVKPETGRMGFLFRKIESADELRIYHKNVPINYIVQDFIDYPVEVSVFYYRFPDQLKGTITGFVKKEGLAVFGNGRSSLLELIKADQRANQWTIELKQKHAEKLDTIIPKGERFCLSHALNLSRGGRLVNIEHKKDSDLLSVFDKLSHYAEHFYYGRYDIKCASIDDLKRGKNFTILEYNGSGGEPHHVYGNGNSLIRACRILHQHWSILYKISNCNYKKGIPYWDLREGWRFFREANLHVQKLKKLDVQIPAGSA